MGHALCLPVTAFSTAWIAVEVQPHARVCRFEKIGDVLCRSSDCAFNDFQAAVEVEHDEPDSLL